MRIEINERVTIKLISIRRSVSWGATERMGEKRSAGRHQAPLSFRRSTVFSHYKPTNWMYPWKKLQLNYIKLWWSGFHECRKVIGFAPLCYMIGLKNSRHFFIQSQVKPKPNMTYSHRFTRALRQLYVTTSSLNWITVLSVSFVIGWLDYFGFGLTTLNWKPL